MTGKKTIIKFADIFIYILVLYYLLPFSPINLYLSAHQQTTSFYEAKNEKPDVLSYNKIRVNNNTSFVNKDKNRFDVEALISIRPLLQKVSFSFVKYSFHYLIFQSDPLIYCNSNRGPPALRSFSYSQS